MDAYPNDVPIKGRVGVCLDMVRGIDINNKVVVDVGCSFGWLEKEIVKLNPRKVIGIDPEERALAFARKTVPGAKFIEGSATNISLFDSTADVVILFDVIEHVPKNKELAVMKEVNRILKKGGVLLFSTPNFNLWSNLFDIAWYFGHRHYKVETILNFISKTGFKVRKLYKKGSLFSSLYLTWFYVAKRILGVSQPRSDFFERLDDAGYKKAGITDIFLIAVKK